MAKDKITLLLDSGAYTAWKYNTTVDLKAYTKFALEQADRIVAAVNLDVIPGQPGYAKADAEAAAAASDRNLQYMLDRGVPAMPVYHQFEHPRWLAKMLKDGHDYIGISPSDRQPTRRRMEWLDEVYTMLCDAKGRPCVKTHAFGVTSIDILAAYPFYTADSSTWLKLPGHGRLQLPSLHAVNGKTTFNYGKQVILTVSPKSATTKSPRQMVLMDKQRDQIREYLDEAGFTEDEIQNDYIARSSVSIYMYERVVKHIRANPVRFARRRSWIKGVAPELPPMLPLPPFKMRLFYVAWAAKAHFVLRNLGMTNRLLSYFHVADWSPDEFDAFMETGLIGGSYVPRRARTNGPRKVYSSTEASTPGAGPGRSAPPAGAPMVRRRARPSV